MNIVKKEANTGNSAFNPVPNNPWFLCVCNTSVLKKTAGKGEIAQYEQFLLFSQFSTLLESFLSFSSNVKLISTKSSSFEESKICRLGNGQVL